ERPVTGVREHVRLGVTLLVADVIGQLRLQPALQAPLDQFLDEPAVTVELDLAGVDLREQVVEDACFLETLRALFLSVAARFTRLLVDRQCGASFRKETHPLHTPFDRLFTSPRRPSCPTLTLS